MELNKHILSRKAGWTLLFQLPLWMPWLISYRLNWNTLRSGFGRIKTACSFPSDKLHRQNKATYSPGLTLFNTMATLNVLYSRSKDEKLRSCVLNLPKWKTEFAEITRDQLAYLKQSVEGSDVVSFLQLHLPSWTHTLAGHEIPIKRAKMAPV